MGSVAAVVRSLREDSALTQEELAARSGLSVRTVSDVERGLRTRLYRETAERLGTALGLSDERLFEFVEHARGRSPEFHRDLDADFHRRFVAWHLDRVSALAASVGNEEAWFAVLDADEPNLEVALRWAREDRDTESLLQLASGLFRYWLARGQLVRGRQWLESGLAAAPAARPQLRAAALWGLAWLAFHQGDQECAERCAAHLAALADEIDDPTVRRNSGTVSGMAALHRADHAQAVAHLSAALEDANRLGQPWLHATSLLNLGMAKVAVGDTGHARSLIREALREYDGLGDERFRARALGYLALAAVVDGDLDRAESLYAQSLTVFELLAEAKGIAEGLSGLALTAAIRGLDDRAARLAGAAERVREAAAASALPVEKQLTDRELERAAERKGPAHWQSEWTRGRALRLDDAITLALNPSRDIKDADPMSASA